ncbi:MAG TPA: condensation domain-containing protein, partial [Pseudomonadales bacterium]|nr:condensation domain-containing protein [Pseudomonadales bacterium]
MLRHPMLRTTFTDTPDGPRQTVHRSIPANFQEVDARQWNEQRINDWIEQEADKPFDLSHESALRVSVLYGQNETLLLASVHHIATDLWGLVLIAADIQRDYSALIQGEWITVTPPKHQYREHVQWQQNLIASDAGLHLQNYWLDALRGASMQLDLPLDYSRPAVMTMRGDKSIRMLSSALAAKVRQFCKQEAITPFVLFQSVFQLLAYALTGRQQFLVGTPTVGRSAPGMEEVVGDFANPVVLRAEVVAKNSAKQLLQQVKQTVLEALKHQDYPFPLLIQRLNPPRDASRTPVFQLMFLWHQGNPGAAFQQGLLQGILPQSGPRGTPYDLMLAVSDLGDSFELNWHYATALFTAETIDRFADAF